MKVFHVRLRATVEMIEIVEAVCREAVERELNRRIKAPDFSMDGEVCGRVERDIKQMIYVERSDGSRAWVASVQPGDRLLTTDTHFAPPPEEVADHP